MRTHLELQRVNRQLAEQNKIMQEIVLLREDIDRITRHDMKSPLTVVISGPELVKQGGNLSEKQITSLNLIRTAGYRLLDMVNRTMDIYKMEMGTYILKPIAVDVRATLDCILAELASIADTKEIVFQIEVNTGSGNPSTQLIMGEELLCYSMLVNLLKNAIEASPPGEAIDIRLTETDKYGCITICNKGEVPKEIRGELFFDKYVTRGKERGTGLGTYSAKLLAVTQHGEISLNCSRKGYTTIQVCLLRAVGS